MPYAFCADYVPRTPAARAALLTLLRDTDAEARLRACEAGMRGEAAAALASSPDRTLALSDAQAASLGEDNHIVRLEAAYGLALRDDPRTAEAIERIGPLGDGFEHDHRADEF